MATNIFSTYRTGENRITASILAVLRSLSLDRIERLIGALLEQSEFELLRFRNQPSSGAPGVPDAEIIGSCRILVETKIKRDAVDPDQLKRHLDRLEDAAETTRVLLVITPDDTAPTTIAEMGDERLAWASFASLDQSIDELLDDKQEVISEREAFLLRELQAMLLEEGLLRSANDVVVVPARRAWPEYEKHHAYVCQPNRSFQPVSRIAFYSQNRIHPLVPEILEIHEAVTFDPEQLDGELRRVVVAFCQDPESSKKQGEPYKVFLLTRPDDPRTIRLEAQVINDLRSEAGRPVAFTQNQRYVSSEALKTATRTSELVGD